MSLSGEFSAEAAARRSVVLAFAANGNKAHADGVSAEVFITQAVVNAYTGRHHSAADVVEQLVKCGELRSSPDQEPSAAAKHGPLHVLELTPYGLNRASLYYQRLARLELEVLADAEGGSAKRPRCEAEGVGLTAAFDRLAVMGQLAVRATPNLTNGGCGVEYVTTGQLTETGRKRLTVLKSGLEATA